MCSQAVMSTKPIPTVTAGAAHANGTPTNNNAWLEVARAPSTQNINRKAAGSQQYPWHYQNSCQCPSAAAGALNVMLSGVGMFSENNVNDVLKNVVPLWAQIVWPSSCSTTL
jgi:hypothetical protein